MNPLVEQKLKEKNITPTAMRMLVLDHLLGQSSALSLTDLELGLEHSDRVTLYRTIKGFEKHGLVHKIDDGSGTAKFALCDDTCSEDEHHDLHVHFYCVACKETFCLPATQIPDVHLPENYKSREMELTVKGTCAACS